MRSPAEVFKYLIELKIYDEDCLNDSYIVAEGVKITQACYMCIALTRAHQKCIITFDEMLWAKKQIWEILDPFDYLDDFVALHQIKQTNTEIYLDWERFYEKRKSRR